jgi:putative hydrolase of the HAD superfamily
MAHEMKQQKKQNSATVVFFDVGGVLLRDFIEEKIIDLALKYEKYPGDLLALKSKYRPLADAGKISDRDFWSSILRDVGVSAVEEDYSLDAYMRPIMGGFELAKRLKDQGFRIAILSNDSKEMSRQRRNIFGLDELFDDVIISSEHGVIKPNAATYQIALKRMNVRPADAIFIDDKIENVLAAQKVGMQALHFQNAQQAEKELMIMGIDLSSKI